ncbi:hypothetical protein BN946_scf184721.g5 [Trametes cinnabarina]|uniref:DUF6532 domain-containing protein n=1 Tax=Pycnoporus cinnabarinus TaxID=5643 RepID=A0A060SJ69_PYCCI|nr:hypothetical protein BN946_scf184721.g5 [Trametes cinnabarina]
MLPDLSNVEDSTPAVVESRASTKHALEPVKHTKPKVSEHTSECGVLVPAPALCDGETSSSASDSEYNSSGEDGLVEDSDLEILERDPNELERQLSAERPRWTSESSEPVVLEARNKDMEQMGNDKVARKTHKQPNVEHPIWKDLPETQIAPLLNVLAPKTEPDIGDSKDGLRAPNANTAAASQMGANTYQLVFPEKSGPLNLLAQHAHIQAAARQSFIRVERELVMTHAFPNTLLRQCFVREALAASARELGHKALEAQILDNDQFARTLGSIPNQRISTFRSELKDLAQNSTAAHYGLVPGQCALKVKWLLGELIYIYPNLDFERNSGSWEKPYGHPLVLHILQQAFFGGPDSVSRRFPEIFVSSLQDKSEEHELPMAMVALVGTAIHAGLLQWQTGQFMKIEFSGNTFIDKYREHITFMMHTQTENARGYHTAMHNLYKAASGLDHTAPASSSAHAASAISRLAIHRMEVS